MTNAQKCNFRLLSLAGAILISGCVSQSSYDALLAQNQQLQQQSAAQAAQLRRLQGAIKYTVESDLLFASGSWQLRPAGKNIIARLATKLAPTQQNHLWINGYTDNAPIGKALQAQGVTSNEVLSQKRADSVMQFLVSQGMNPTLLGAKGFGEADPVASNDTAKGRAANRRVELTLSPS
jgi:chemotaxis protein MotB